MNTTSNKEPHVPDAATKRAELEAEISNRGKRVMSHMNADHEDSLVAYVLAFATGVEGTDPELDKEDALLRNIQKGMLAIASAQLTAVDADGFLLEIKALETITAGEKSEILTLSNVRVPYDKPIESAKDLHHIAIAMHQKAYHKLGIWYKTKNGYYKPVAKMVAFKSYKAVQKSPPSVVAGIGTLAVATTAAGYLRYKSRA